MAISIRAVGTPVYGTANITATIPAAQLAGDMMLCFYGTKPYNDAPTIDQGWASLGYATDGTVAAGIDVGSMQARIFWKIATSDTETNPIITNSTNNISTAVIIVFQKGASDTWVTPVGAGGGDATAGTGFSVTMSSDVGHTTGDYVAGFAAFRSDGATPTTARNLTITGCTLGTYTQSPATDPETTSGGDMGMTCGYRSVDSGTSSAAPIMTATLGAAHTGSAFWARLRVTVSTTYYQTLPAIEVAVAVISKLYTWTKSLPGVEVSVVVMSEVLTWVKSLSVTEVGISVLSKISTFYKTLDVVSIETATLIKQMYKTLSVQTANIAVIIKASIYTVTMPAISGSTVIIGRLLTWVKVLAATSSELASILTIKTIFKTLSSTVACISSLVTQFIPGGGGGVINKNLAARYNRMIHYEGRRVTRRIAVLFFLFLEEMLK